MTRSEFEFKIFELPPQTPSFGESRKIFDALKITSFGHINIPPSLVIYLYFLKLSVRWGGGG